MDDTSLKSPAQSVWERINAALPRMWAQWLISLILVLALLFVVSTIVGSFTSAVERAGVILAKVPLITIGGLLGYYGDRSLFPYARPGDILDELNAKLEDVEGEASSDNYIAQAHMAESLTKRFDNACLRRAIIVGAAILGAALGA